MKFSLTIMDATKEEIAAFFGGSLPSIALTAPVIHTTGAMSTHHTAAPTNDDDNGAVNVNAPAVDTAGFPWNETIHSKNKALNADGTWRKRRGVDAATVANVEAAMRGNPAQPQMMQPQTMQMPVHQPQPGFTPPPMPDQQMMQPQPQMQMPVHQPQPQMQQPQTMDFQSFMTHLAGQMSKRDAAGAPLITTDYLAGVCQKLTAHFQRQFNSITEISSDPNAIAAAIAFISNDGRWS